MTARSELFAQMLGVGQDILCTFVDKVTATILAQLGDATNGVADIDEAEWAQHVGFWSRPAKPTPGAPVNGCIAAQAYTIKNGDRDIAIASRDIRTNKIYGNLKDGETCVGATVGQARSFWKADGSISHMTTADNTPGGTTIVIYAGTDKIQLANQFASITLDANGITLTAGQAALLLTATGDAKLIGQTASVNGSVAAIAGTVMTMIGAHATAKTAAVIALPSVPTLLTGVGSATVFISP